MLMFCRAMHKEASISVSTERKAIVCGACYMLRSVPQTETSPLRDRDVAFDEKHDMDGRLMLAAGKRLQEVMGVDWAEPGADTTATQQLIRDAHVSRGTLRSRDPINLQNVPKAKIWADTQNELSGKMVRCAPREVGKGLDWNSVMRGFRCIQPNKTRLPFWAPYQSWADLVCPHCSSSVSQGLTSGHHEMDGASPITLAMLRKEVPADDLRFAEPRANHTPSRSMVVGVDREALGHVEALLGHFTTQDFVSGNPDKRRALANALAWLNDNK